MAKCCKSQGWQFRNRIIRATHIHGDIARDAHGQLPQHRSKADPDEAIQVLLQRRSLRVEKVRSWVEQCQLVTHASSHQLKIG